MEMTITEHRNFQKLEKQRLMTLTKCELVEELLAVYKHCRKLQNTSSNSDYAKSKSCANCSKLYQCNDVRRHSEWHCEKHDFA